VTLRVASCAYPLERPRSFEAYAAKQASWVETAAQRGAQLLLFPEYASLELSALLPAADSGELRRELAGLQRFLAGQVDCFARLARQHALHILAPSFPELAPESGLYHNRARLHAPSGAVGVLEKLQMTRFEAEVWGIDPGERLQVFETALGPIGVAICYDSEFPQLVRQQIALGAELLLVPSCTDTLAGYHRVSLSCRARALENQCYVAQSSLLGQADWSLAIDRNHGAAAVYGPIDRGFAQDGVIVQGTLDAPGWVFADLDLAALAEVRENGQVRNHRDWHTPAHTHSQAVRVRLG
jgi:predicted amidohydrolase